MDFEMKINLWNLFLGFTAGVLASFGLICILLNENGNVKEME